MAQRLTVHYYYHHHYHYVELAGFWPVPTPNPLSFTFQLCTVNAVKPASTLAGAKT